MNYTPMEYQRETNNSPSLCVPDDCLTIRQLFDRYSRGETLNIARTPEYEDVSDDSLDRDSCLDTIPLDIMDVYLEKKYIDERIKGYRSVSVSGESGSSSSVESSSGLSSDGIDSKTPTE